MCGICGIYSPKASVRHRIDDVRDMNHVLRHRGPDDQGIYESDSCIFGHRRLSIIDLSSNGHQPFVSADGNYVLIYNGEIYNYRELRDELKALGYIFRTKTDTEVLLCMFIQFGSDCLSKLNGMFAFAIFDRRNNELFLARDRLGIKPLYYIYEGDVFCFASEIKALKAISRHNLTTNHQAVFDFLCFNRTDIFDETFYTEVKRLPKGHYATISSDGMKISKWWDPEKFIGQSSECTEKEMLMKTEDIMVSSVQLRMRSDVPVGSCLSGGLDSSILMGIVNKQCHTFNGEYKTFTAAFPGHTLDETKYVESLNAVMPFTNYRVYPSATAALDNFAAFSFSNDEPVPNPSFYSQYEVMRCAKQNGVTVVLDGQGGDENFAGYQYFHGFYLHGLLKQHRYLTCAAELLHVLARRQASSAYATLLFQLLPANLKKKALRAQTPYIDKDYFAAHIDKSIIFNKFFDTDSLNKSLVRHFQYKLEHLLRMEDRNSMAFSIEARVPYLDYRLVEYVLSLADETKIRSGQTKYLQKKALSHYTIPEILARKDKIGFGTPVDDWMKTRGWIDKSADSFKTLVHGSNYFKKTLNIDDFNAQDKWKLCSLSQCMS